MAYAACGKKGAPLPPLLRVPAPVAGTAAVRVGDDVYVRFTVPTANVDQHTPADIARVEVFAITPDRPPTQNDKPAELRRLATLVGSEQVRKPLPPLPPPKPGGPERPALPSDVERLAGPGVDQGAVVVVRDVLPANARERVTLPAPENVRRGPPTGESLSRPLVAPVDSTDPIRYYFAVGVSPSGRYGPMQSFIPIPLGSTSSAPSAPALTHDEKTLTIRWNPPNDARGVVAPPAPDVLPSKPVVPGPAATSYDVYEVPPDAAANQSPSMPVALTPTPVAALELKVPVTSFGTERCFIVRAVDNVSGYDVRGPASPRGCVTLKDTFAPAPPKSLAAVASAGSVNLIWEPSDSSDVAGYIVLRAEAAGATLAPLMEAPMSETTFVDKTARAGTTYVYAVVAVDKAGNRSAESNRVEETAR